MKAIIDSDVLIDYLQGLDKAKREIERYEQPEISIISWMEIMSGADTAEEEKTCRQFLARFVTHQISVEVATEAVRIRKHFKVRLPDAIIWATARVNGCILVTRNSRDFPKQEPGVRIPYAS
jgi:predicted nucleic acid-binding protein